MKRVVMNHVTKTYWMKEGVKLETLDQVNLELGDKEFVAIIGPSGCGKSTIFRLIAKIEERFEGKIFINGTSIQDSNETIGYMQQKDLLMPWRSIMANVVLPLELKGYKKKRSHSVAQEHMEKFGLKGFENAWPHQLSGGMRQRAALLRTFLMDSSIMLLDEPFGALDAMTRLEMQQWLLTIWEENQKSVLFVTHDIDEAIFLSDRIYVMSQRPGKMIHEQRIDFERPRNPDLMLTEKYLAYKKVLIEKFNQSTK